MKIGILTFHNAKNYGATLQAYALRKILETKQLASYSIEEKNRYINLNVNPNPDFKFKDKLFQKEKREGI